ncbi:hypothetical protein [Bradyrhizobium ivorense]|uniref:hypothetical protein n=1 Tax=Bradyrhizobium ivorense TaxID=2511166 RepID=UPI00111788B1|nr:hypothetical protein [Bradyrhizobium ivorense]
MKPIVTAYRWPRRITNLASTATTTTTVANVRAVVYGIWKSLTAIAAATMMVKIPTSPSDWVRTNIWDDAGRAEDMTKRLFNVESAPRELNVVDCLSQKLTWGTKVR